MKRLLAIAIIAAVVLTGGIIGYAVAHNPEKADSGQMEEYIDMVKTLQQGGDSARAEVRQMLENDSTTWTLLDEIGDYDIDERDEYMTLHLNDLAYELASSHISYYGDSKGVFVDGRDKDYDICFIEKCLDPASEVVYSLTDRSGLEQIAIIEMEEGDLDVIINNVRVEPSDCVFRGEFRGGNGEIRLRNRRAKTVSFVIINQH